MTDTLDPNSWVDHFVEWAEGREDVLDFHRAEVPTRVQNLLTASFGDTLEDFQAQIYQVNLDNGWFEDDRTVGDDLALLHSEVSEALEAFRSWGLRDVTTEECKKHDHSHPITNEQLDANPCKPEGFGSELADVFVRLLDTCQRRGINLRAEVVRKIAYNATRGHRHGGKGL